LRTCGGRCVDNDQIELPLLCCSQPFRQSPLREKFNVRKITLAAICPDNCAFLLVEIEQRSPQPDSHRQIDGDGRLADPAFLRDESYFLQNCDPVSNAMFQVCTPAQLTYCCLDVKMAKRIGRITVR
jgi:hypothetical protein